MKGESMERDIMSKILPCSAVEKGRSKIRQISYPKNKLVLTDLKHLQPPESPLLESNIHQDAGCFKT